MARSEAIDIDQEHLAYVQFEPLEPMDKPGAERHFQYQPSRDRIVYWEPENHKMVAVEFLKDVDESVRNHPPRADLRDLVLGGTGATLEDLNQLLQDSGINTIMPPPRYKNNPQPEATQEDALGQ